MMVGRPIVEWSVGLASRTILEDIVDGVESADLMIADISEANANVFLELGVRLHTRKPFMLVSQGAGVTTFDISGLMRFVYDPPSARSFVPLLATHIAHVLANPGDWRAPWAPQSSGSARSTVFVSYAHQDVQYVTRLRVHLKPLERLGLIELWDDSRIKAGEKWKETIEAALERASVALLVISADFLASDFIVGNELPPLLRAAEERGTTVMPIIAKPSRFTRDPHLSIFQAINDPAAPLISATVADQEAVYAKIAERVEKMFTVTGAPS